MFHQTNDAKHFRDAAWLTEHKFKPTGNHWTAGKERYLPLYEVKMVQMFDHRAADVVVESENWMRQGQTHQATAVEHANPEHFATPRAWVAAKEISDLSWGTLGFKDITSPTNQRTMIASAGPSAAYTNHFVLIRSTTTAKRQQCLLANFNSFVSDYVTRQKIGGITLNFFIVEQLPILPPDRYDEPCPWAKGKTLEAWIAERVLKLTCTAEDMLPLADACSFTGGSFKAEYGGRLHKWNERERAEMMAELDAAFFHLYGLDHDDAEYVLSTFKGIHAGNPLLPGHPSTAKFIMELYDGITMTAASGG